MRTTRHALGVFALIAAAGCAPATTIPADPGEGAAPTPEQSRDQARLLPPGYGTLRQDQLSLQLRSGDLLVKVTPLDEAVIRLAAPDTYERLHAMAESRREQARQSVYGGEPEMLLVSYFSYAPDTGYRPEDLQLIHVGRTLTPADVLPLTSGWGRGRLQQREVQNAIYVFREDVDYAQPMTVLYGDVESGDWRDVIPSLERERARVRARAGS